MAHLVDLWPNPDVFIHTGLPYPACPGFWKRVRPASYVVEPQRRHPEIHEALKRCGYWAEHYQAPYIQQLHGLGRVWDAVEERERQQGFQYDLVVRTRPDLIFFADCPPSLFDLEGFSDFLLEGEPTMSTEFACGPRALMAPYFRIADWLVDRGEEFLRRDDPRLVERGLPGQNSDTILAVYYRDALGIERMPPRIPEGYCCRDYFRIAYRHAQGCYEHPQPKPLPIQESP
jgi:hypothetical protein